MSIPMQLTPQQAEVLTDYLLRSKQLLSDAACPSPIHTDSDYAKLAGEIGDVLDAIGIQN